MTSFKEFVSKSRFNLEKFKKECAPFLHMIKGTEGKSLLYRGDRGMVENWEIANWQARTAPRNTNINVHHAANEYFQKHYGAPMRNWMFASGDIDQAVGYSSPSKIGVIFPIGDFEWMQGETIHDFTAWFNAERGRVSMALSKQNPDISWDETLHKTIEKLPELMDEIKWHHNENLVDCINRHEEIMFKCNKFYVFNYTGDTFNKSVKPFLKTL